MPPLSRRHAIRVLLCLLWSAGVVVGWYRITAYSNLSGESVEQPRQWPVRSHVMRAGDRPTLLVTLHPHCACSRATLEELERLLVQAPQPILVEVLLYEPAGAPESWAETDLTRKARTMPGVTVRVDPNGMEAERFGMTISGYTALYSADGSLLFSGGITHARGHAGDNAGRAAIVALLSNRKPETTRTRVFGCSTRDLRNEK